MMGVLPKEIYYILLGAEFVDSVKSPADKHRVIECVKSMISDAEEAARLSNLTTKSS